jgi:hypothetical protein
MTRTEMLDAIERDRTKREVGLTLWLLALAEKSRRYVNRAIRVGSSWADALRSVLLGNPALDLPGGVPLLSRAMAETHHAGIHRVGRIVGVPLPPAVPLADLAGYYRPTAAGALERVRGALQAKVTDALGGAVEADRISADVRAVGEAFEVAGYSAANPWAAAAEATMAVTTAYGAGMSDGFNADELRDVLMGLRSVAVGDERTTEVCRAYDGVQLPPLDPWWHEHWVPRHWNCRSVILPIMGRFEPTENPPWSPAPAVGFGLRPVVLVPSFA